MLRHYLVITAVCLVAPLSAAAQGIVIPEEVLARCPDRPHTEKVRLAVARFSNSVDGSNSQNIDNFSTMLSNAMFEVDCFRMLEMLQDSNYDDQTGFDDLPVKPHMIITGEITEYNHTSKEEGNFIRKKEVVTAHLGYVLQIKDPVTREIFFSKSFNQDGSSESSSMQFEVKGMNFSSSSNESVDKAYFDAFEKGILEAVTYVVDRQGDIYEIAGGVMAATEAERELVTTSINVLNVDFMGLRKIEGYLKDAPFISSIEKSLSGSNGHLAVRHLGSAEDLLDLILVGAGDTLEVTGFEENAVELTVK